MSKKRKNIIPHYAGQVQLTVMDKLLALNKKYPGNRSYIELKQVSQFTPKQFQVINKQFDRCFRNVQSIREAD